MGYSHWDQTPLGRGFESHLGYLQGQGDYYGHTLPSCKEPVCIYKGNANETGRGSGASGFDFWDGKEPLYEREGEYSMDSYMGRLDRILRPYGVPAGAPAPPPLFLYLAEQSIHIPIQAPPGRRLNERCRGVTGGQALTNRTTLCAMAGSLDDSLGQVATLLKKYRMWNETLVWVVSDNGGMTNWADNFPASASSNWPLRGGKTTVHEGGVRVVSFLFGGWIPETARRSKRSALMHVTDVMPTMTRLAVGKATPADGLDIWEALIHGGPTRQSLPLNIAVNRDLALTGPNLNPLLKNGREVNYTAVIEWPWKLVVGEAYINFGAKGLSNPNPSPNPNPDFGAKGLGPVRDKRARDGYWTVQGYCLQP